MKAISFELGGKTACFRKPDVNVYAYFTYNNIHKPALLGLLGAIIGLGGHTQLHDENRGKKPSELTYNHNYPEFYKKLQHLKVSIVPLAPNGYFSKRIEPLKLVVMQMFVAGILFVINFFIFSDVSKIEKPAGMTLISIIYLTIFSTAIPTVLQTFCQKYTTSTRASILMSTESLFAPLFAFFILNERLSLRVAVGAGLVLFAVLISETKLGLKKLVD